MLTEAQLNARKDKLTGSVIKILVNGTAEEVLSLWKQMLGLEKPADLSGVWPVRLGEATEQLHLDWQERKLGPITRRGEVVVGKIDWMAATLDGFIEQKKIPIEAKHCGGREPLETIIARYLPQCTWQMMVTGAKQCALSVIMGANEPIIEYLDLNKEFAATLLAVGEKFMHHLETLTPPVELPKVTPPPPPTKDYDMTGQEAWQKLASQWIQAYGAAITAKESEKAIKALVPIDAAKCFGHGIIVTRNRAGAMSLREQRNESR